VHMCHKISQGAPVQGRISLNVQLFVVEHNNCGTICYFNHAACLNITKRHKSGAYRTDLAKHRYADIEW